MPTKRPNSIRLSGYDYSECGAYSFTVCTKNRGQILGEVVDGTVRLNDFGRLVEASWAGLPGHYEDVALDAFVVMPDHVHGIILLGIQDRAGLKPAPTEGRTTPCRHSLSEIVRAFKTFSAKRINECRGMPGASVWQRGYYDHILRNEKALERIRLYIELNPLRWSEDLENVKGGVRRIVNNHSDFATSRLRVNQRCGSYRP